MSTQKILQLGSLVPGAVPLASQLVTSISGVEIAINAADGKLFYKDVSGTVRVLADVTATNRAEAAITSGTIDGANIGTTVPGTGRFTEVITSDLVVPPLTGILKSQATDGVTIAAPGVDYLAPSSIGIANGVASLNASGQVPLIQLPQVLTGGLYYAGFWDADANVPALASSVGTNGVYYKVSVAGTTSLDAESTWNVGDIAIFNGLQWGRLPEVSSAPVQSVNGQTGIVTITAANLGAAASGNNSDITSLSGLTTAISVIQGGTGVSGLSGIIKADGSAPFTAAIAGTDYAIPPTGTNAQLLANNGAGGFANVSIGSGLLYSSGVLSATAASTGTVTSVDVSGGTTGLVFNDGPITNLGTITMDGVLAIEHGGTGKTTRQEALNNLAGSTISGTFLRANGNDVIMSGIQASDVPTLNQDTTGTASAVTNPSQPAITSVGQLVNLSVTGPTDLLGPLRSVGNSGTLGQVLTSAGEMGPPIWRTIATSSGNSGTVTSINISSGTTGLTFGGGPITTAGTFVMGGVLSVSHGGTGVTTSTGSGAIVKESAPVISGATLVNGEANNLRIGIATPTEGAFTQLAAEELTAEVINLGGELTILDDGRIRVSGTIGLAGQILASGGDDEAPSWINAGSVSSVGLSMGTTGLTVDRGPITDVGTFGISGTLAVSHGGTGVTSSTGTGSVVLSNSPILVTPDLGMPSAVNLSNATDLPINGGTTGILPVNRGGTGTTSLTGILKGNGSLPITTAMAGTDYASPPTGTTSQLLANNGNGGFSNITVGTGLSLASGTLVATGAGAVTSVNVGGGTTGLVFTGGPITTSGTLVMSGILSPANGGTGSTSITGLIKGNGNAPASAAIAGIDYAPATTATTAQLLAGDGDGGFNNVIVGEGLFLANGTLTSVSGTGTVSSVTLSGGDTGLIFLNGEITHEGTATLAGRLSVPSGGTGASSIFGLVKGNGTAAFSAAAPRVDYAPATTATLNQLLAGDGGGGFTNVNLGIGLSYVNGVLNTTGMGPQGSVLTFAGRYGTVVPQQGDYNALQIDATDTQWNPEITVQAQLDAIGSNDGSDFIGFTANLDQAIPRSVSSKLEDFLSVLDFGADPTGSLNSGPAFNAAYEAAVDGQAILIPKGQYQGVTVAGSKYVTWIAYGKPLSASLWNLPGNTINHAGFKQVIARANGTSDDGGSGTSTIRRAIYSGGSPLVINSAATISTEVSQANTNKEQNLWLVLDSLASSSGNTALRVDAYANGSGGVDAASVTVASSVVDPTSEVTGLSITAAALGGDGNGVRSGLIIKTKRLGASRSIITNGLLISSGADNAVFANGLHVNGEFESGLLIDAAASSTAGAKITGLAAKALTIEGSPTVGISIGASTNVGIDLSAGIHSEAALRIREAAKLSFTSNDSGYLTHTAGGLTYYAGAMARHQLMDNGDLFISNRLSVTNAAVTSTSGGASGTYLTILINGQPFKLALMNAS